MLTCPQHRAAAGWRCTQCQRPLCPACAAPSSGLVVCTYCGGLAEVLRERRAVLRPFRGEIVSAIRWPFQRAGVLTCAAAAVVLWALVALWIFGAVIAAAVLLTHLFEIVRHTAGGADEFPGPGDFRGWFEDILAPLLRISLVSAWVLGPALWWEMRAGGTLSAPFVALLAMGAFLFPMALIAAALPGPIAQVVNPAIVVGNAFRLGADYLFLAGFCLACVMAEMLLNALCGVVFARFPLPGLWRDFVLLFPLMAMSRALGLFVRNFGDRLGYGLASDYLDPVLGPAEPRGKAPPTRQAARPSIELADPDSAKR
jgi:hypothetical protein